MNNQDYTIRRVTNTYEDISGVYSVIYPEGYYNNIDIAYKQKYVLDCILKQNTYVAEVDGEICGLYTFKSKGNSVIANIDYKKGHENLLTPLFEAAKEYIKDNKFEHAAIFNDAASREENKNPDTTQKPKL